MYFIIEVAISRESAKGSDSKRPTSHLRQGITEIIEWTYQEEVSTYNNNM